MAVALAGAVGDPGIWSHLLGLLTSPASAQTPSDDASLSDLTLSQGRLEPTFASATTEYSASVGYTVTQHHRDPELGQ